MPETYTESFKVAGQQLVDAGEEARPRRQRPPRDHQTRRPHIAEFPPHAWCAGAVLDPMLAAIAAIAAAVKECTIEVERMEPPSERKGAA